MRQNKAERKTKKESSWCQVQNKGVLLRKCKTKKDYSYRKIMMSSKIKWILMDKNLENKVKQKSNKNKGILLGKYNFKQK